MSRELLALSFGLGLAWIAATPAPAQTAQTCADHETVVSQLADQWGEARQSMGLAGNNTVVEVFADLTTGTWSITVTRAGGQTCLVASGDGYQHMADVKPGDDTPA